ncbi:hypothetical protein [Streptomyces sp. NPDC020983]|uniref:hypothetical protein n=1 Tax=Streptomyces sp. NPDC020983 TaxID=3365106 RepID=UPI0037B208AB
MTQLAATWVRVGDQWVRADRIIGVQLEPEATDRAPSGRWSSTPGQRLLVCVTLPTEEEDGTATWREAAVCAKDRAEAVAGTLLDAIHTAKGPSGGLRYVYPVRTETGPVSHWQQSTTLPQEETLTGVPAPRVSAITGLATVDRTAARGA